MITFQSSIRPPTLNSSTVRNWAGDVQNCQHAEGLAVLGSDSESWKRSPLQSVTQAAHGAASLAILVWKSVQSERKTLCISSSGQNGGKIRWHKTGKLDMCSLHYVIESYLSIMYSFKLCCCQWVWILTVHRALDTIFVTKNIPWFASGCCSSISGQVKVGLYS